MESKSTNKQNRNRLIATENRLRAARRSGVGSLGEKGEGIKQKYIKKLRDTENNRAITRRKGAWGEVEEGKGGINGIRRRHALCLGVLNTKYRWCMIELCTWNLYNFINQCHLSKVNKNKKEKHYKPEYNKYK